MTKQEALNQLCKMMDTVALYNKIETPCICGESSNCNPKDEVPDVIIEDMWGAVNCCFLREKCENK